MEINHNLEEFNNLICSHGVFKNLNPNEIVHAVSCMHGEIVNFKAGENISTSGDAISLLLSGMVLYLNYDMHGNRSIIDYSVDGDILCAAGSSTVICASRDSICLSVHKTLAYFSLQADIQERLDTNLCTYHRREFLRLQKKCEILAMRTLTDKILGYLIFQHELSGKQKFKIPLNRQEFADYLYVNRTSLSSALSSMQRKGIIELKNNRFTILNPQMHV